MKSFRFIFLILITTHMTLKAQDYKEDILGAGFEQTVIRQPDDYEGSVITILIRKKAVHTTNRAVLYIHGFNDYFFQKEMAEEFTRHNYNFYAVDLRKYGRAHLPHQKLNNVRDLTEYYADIDSALQIIQKEGNQKVLLSGHSTGGLVAALYADSHNGSPLFSAVFLNSPFFDFNMNAIVKKIGIPYIAKKGLKKPDKTIKGGFTELYGKSLHKNDYGEWDYNLNWKPHIAPEVNYGFIRAIHSGHQKVKDSLTIDKPVLVLFSKKSITEKKWSDVLFTGDAILNVKDIESGARKIKGLVTLKPIDGGLHDLILSPKPVRENVYKVLFYWLDDFMN